MTKQKEFHPLIGFDPDPTHSIGFLLWFVEWIELFYFGYIKQFVRLF